MPVFFLIVARKFLIPNLHYLLHKVILNMRRRTRRSLNLWTITFGVLYNLQEAFQKPVQKPSSITELRWLNDLSQQPSVIKSFLIFCKRLQACKKTTHWILRPAVWYFTLVLWSLYVCELYCVRFASLTLVNVKNLWLKIVNTNGKNLHICRKKNKRKN